MLKSSLAAALLIVAVIVLIAEPAEIAATLASDLLCMHVKMGRLTFSSPTTIAVENVYLAGGRFPRPVGARQAHMDFSPLSYLCGKEAISTVDFKGLTLRINTDCNGNVDERTRAELASLGLVLTGLDPQVARAREVTILLSSPFLPKTRSLIGSLSFIATEGGYRSRGSFADKELLLRLDGALNNKEKTGEFTVKVDTLGQGTKLHCDVGSKAHGQFSYRSKLSMRGENDKLEIKEAAGICQLKELKVRLPWFDEDVICSQAQVVQGPPMSVKSAEFKVSGMEFSYHGSMAPSRESPGYIYLSSTPLRKLVKRFLPHNPPLPKHLRKAVLSGSLVVKGQSLRDVSGNLNLALPPGSFPGFQETVTLSSAVTYIGERLCLRNGSLKGPIAADQWLGEIDLLTKKMKLEVMRLHSPFSLAHSFAPSIFRGQGNIMASARVSVPLTAPEKTEGDVAFTIIPAAASTNSFPFDVRNAEGRVRFSPAGIDIKGCRLSGEQFSNLEFQGKYVKGKFRGLFLARGLRGAPGEKLNSLTGEIDENNQLNFVFREPGGTEIRCKSGQFISAVFDDMKISAKGALPNFNTLLPTLAQGRLPKLPQKPFEVTLERDDLKLSAQVNLRAFTGGELLLFVQDGKAITPFVSLQQKRPISLQLSKIGVGFNNLQLVEKSGGSLVLSGHIPFVGLPTIEGRASGLVVQHPSFPPLRLTGRADLAWKDGTPKIHAALVAATSKNKGRFRTLSCLISNEENELTIKRLRVRTKDGELFVTGSLPLQFKDNLSYPSLVNGPIKLTLKGKNFDLGCLREVAPSLPVSAGLLSGSLELGGTTLTPSLLGHLSVEESDINLPGTLGALEKLSLHATLRDNSFHIERLGGSWNSLLSFGCDNIAVSAIQLTPTLSANVSAGGGKVSVGGFSADGLSFAGNVTGKNLLSGTLDVERVSWRSETSEMLSEETLRSYVARAEPIVNSRYAMDIKIDAPRNVRIRTSSIAAEFGGKLHLQIGGHNCSASGELAVIRGNLFLQGQKFELSRGTLGFARDPGLEIGGKTLLIPLPRMDIRGETNVLGSPVEIRLRGNPLIDRGMVAHLNSTTLDYSQDRLVQLMSFDEREGRAAAAPFLNEIGYRLLSTGLERSLKKYLPFDDIGIGGGFTFGKDKRPTITMGRYLGKDVYLNLEGGFAPSESFLKELEIDLKPLDGNVRLSFAKDLTGIGEGETTMAVEYSLRF